MQSHHWVTLGWMPLFAGVIFLILAIWEFMKHSQRGRLTAIAWVSFAGLLGSIGIKLQAAKWLTADMLLVGLSLIIGLSLIQVVLGVIGIIYLRKVISLPIAAVEELDMKEDEKDTNIWPPAPSTSRDQLP